jgi:hypothetical protein
VLHVPSGATGTFIGTTSGKDGEQAIIAWSTSFVPLDDIAPEPRHE